MDKLRNALLKDDCDDHDGHRRRRRSRWIRERVNHFDELDDLDFTTRFRLSKQSALLVLKEIEDEISFPSDKNYAVQPMNQLLTTLRFYATGSTQLSVADLNGLSTSTAHRIIHRVSAAIANLRPKYIKMPQTAQDIKVTQVKFYKVARFPKAIGAMDCTHIRISSPGGDDAELFRNRKGYFSLNTQVICNTNLEFQDIVCRWPGSSHDQHVFNSSYQSILFERGHYGDAVILVDGGYRCKPYHMGPLSQPRSAAEQLYNESQIRTRNVVERLFGRWKRRFPVLALGMKIKLDKVFPVVVATAVLHNILRQQGEVDPPDDPSLELPAPWENVLQDGDINELCTSTRINDIYRRKFISYFHSLL